MDENLELQVRYKLFRNFYIVITLNIKLQGICMTEYFYIFIQVERLMDFWKSSFASDANPIRLLELIDDKPYVAELIVAIRKEFSK